MAINDNDKISIIGARVHNLKNVDVDMGIIQDSLPYVLLLSTAGCGSLLLAGGRKRRKKQ